jgi:hypothetical protein
MMVLLTYNTFKNKKYDEFSKTMQGRLTVTEGRGYSLVSRICWKKKKRVLGFKFLGFLGGWVWSEGKKKKRQAQADCVRPSQAPTSTL